jgi:hypothetical protein
MILSILKTSFYITFIIFLFFCIESQAEEARIHLENGIKAYREEANLDKAISEIEKALETGLCEQQDVIQAHLYLGFAYIGKRQRMAAEVEFAKAIRIDSTLTLDPNFHSSKIVAVFNETKEPMVSSISVVSVPGEADVYLDGQILGKTPLKLDDVLTGRHTLRVVKQYFQPEELEIKIVKGRENRFQIQLEKGSVELRIISQPSEATVYIAEEGNIKTKPYGKTPLSIEATLDQKLRIRLSKQDFLDKEVEIKLTEAGIDVSGMSDIIPIENGAGEIIIELAPAPPPGSLKITSDPVGASVYIDGIEMGETPIAIPKVTPGQRSIRVGMSSFASAVKRVEVESNQAIELDFVLGGKLQISSVPEGAQVFVDEIYSGVAPVDTERIPGGSHQIRVSKDGFKDKAESVMVERGQERAIVIRLLPKKGSMYISSKPDGAAVYLNGQAKGETPLFIYGLIVGQYSLRLVKSGYEDWEEQITVEELNVSWKFVNMIEKR